MDSRPNMLAAAESRLLRNAAAVVASSEVAGEGLRARVKLLLARPGPAEQDAAATTAA